MPRQPTHVCLRQPCVYCLLEAREPLPPSVFGDDPELRRLLQRWDTASTQARARFLTLLDHAEAGTPLRVSPSERRTLVETYEYDRDGVLRGGDARPSPYRIEPLTETIGQRPADFLPSELADLVIDGVSYAWAHDASRPAVPMTFYKQGAPTHRFEVEFVRRDERVVVEKFHVVRAEQELLSTIVRLDA